MNETFRLFLPFSIVWAPRFCYQMEEQSLKLGISQMERAPPFCKSKGSVAMTGCCEYLGYQVDEWVESGCDVNLTDGPRKTGLSRVLYKRIDVHVTG